MKDEEMAEQFADNLSGLELTCSLLSAKDKSHAYRLGRYEGFLAGLKAGRPQWHNLRKDPNDLPNNRRNVWITYINGYDQRETTNASFRYKYWVINGHRTECEVIAWCELPTFDKE